MRSVTLISTFIGYSFQYVLTGLVLGMRTLPCFTRLLSFKHKGQMLWLFTWVCIVVLGTSPSVFTS